MITLLAITVCIILSVVGLIIILDYREESFECVQLYSDDSLWESKDIVKFNNCYAYAFVDMDLNRLSKPQPGFKSSMRPIRADNYTCESFIGRVLADNEDALFLGYDSDIAFRNTDCDRHLVFLAVDTVNKDYHFYRRNTDGFWTHKPGSGEVLHVDSKNKLILNPYECAREYEHYNYSTPCGFFSTSSTPN